MSNPADELLVAFETHSVDRFKVLHKSGLNLNKPI